MTSKSDIGFWKQGTGYVIRVYGSEVFITKDDLLELCFRADAVLNGAEESLSEGYKELKYEPPRLAAATAPRRRATIDDLLF